MAPSRVALAKGVATAAGVFVLFGVVSGLVSSLYVRMVETTLLDYAFLTLTAVLAGAYVVQRESLAETACSSSGNRCAYGGAAGGFLAVACPSCNLILVSLVGSSALMTYFDPLRPLFGIVAIGLFGGIIYRRRRRS
ncbi:hypothetical protein OB955_21235 [Halobacteria archaeon AArc-m2/3/4]|uniref:Uncharacterized protein n=1 Tax=Natronoglomus mannanivorans TaxID=2979990 RepID=A0ABT2QK22_9EURY|nr:hypothetical protein [Halobacteria archaeon AArc-m2/3/4]